MLEASFDSETRQTEFCDSTVRFFRNLFFSQGIRNSQGFFSLSRGWIFKNKMMTYGALTAAKRLAPASPPKQTAGWLPVPPPALPYNVA
jgi:hypothetical protein